MKGKFRILGRIGLGVLLVCALMLAFMPVAPVSADVTAVTDVWAEFPMTDGKNEADALTNIYIVHFKATTALLRGTDYVTVTFPDGSEAMGGDGTSVYAFTITDANIADSEVTFSTDYGTAIDTQDLTTDGPTWTSTTNATGGGYRVKARLPVDIAAGQDVWVKFDTTDGIDAAATEASTYRVYVSTTKDTTPVLSNKFALGDTTCEASTDVVTSYPLPATAGATATYIISFVPADASDLTASSGKVTVKFPIGTTVPSSLEITDVSFAIEIDEAFTSTPETPVVNVNTREVTAITPITMEGDGSEDWFIQIKGIGNPTIAAAAHASTYSVMVRTSADGQYDLDSSGYEITAGSPTQILVANGEIGYPVSRYSDDATMVDIYSSQIWLGVADQYGNAKDPDSAVTVNLSSAEGLFYWSDGEVDMAQSGETVTSCTTVTVDEQDPNDSDGDQIVYYKSGTAGTHTLTFSATDYPDVEWTFSVVPGVSVYDSTDTLVKTYAPLSSAPPAEAGPASGSNPYVQKYSGDYIISAIDGAMAGDTVKLGDGIYEIDTSIQMNKKITLTSVNGAASTTIRPTVEPLTAPLPTGYDQAILVQIQGTAANPIIIDGLTFTRLRYETEFDCAVFNNGFDYVTVRNCVLDYIIPQQDVSDQPYGSVVSFLQYNAIAASGDQPITSGTISNNTFTNCCTFGFNAKGEQNNCISVMAKTNDDESTDYTISGVTISGNIITDCNGYGIWIKGYSAIRETVTASVTDNTITNSVTPIHIGGYTDSCEILRNTITGGYFCGIWIQHEASAHGHDNLVIKNNTLTGIAGTASSQSGYDISAAIHIWDDGGSGDPVTVQYNDIYDNDATYSIYAKSDVTGAQSCQYNYFGDASGPAYSALTGALIKKSNPNGTGNQVSDRVTYYPWLHKPLADVVADNASWQTSTMKLVAGWNTLSTPVPLIAEADTIDELIPSGMTIGFYYGATGWTQITTDYTLSPCDAVYVKMSEAKYVQLKFECKTFSTPSKDLAVGWNLISLAYLNSAGLAADEAVISVLETAGNLPGYAQVISPSQNSTRYDIYYNTDTAGWSHASGQLEEGGTMYAGMGYWIYMLNACTLAGFEITPIAPDLD